MLLDQVIQETFVEIAHGVQKVLDRLPEELEEDEAQELWDFMMEVREKVKGVLELLEVTRDKYLATEVVNGDVFEILAEIVARAQLEACRATPNHRSFHAEAACTVIHATRQVEELLQPIVTRRLGSGSWA